MFASALNTAKPRAIAQNAKHADLTDTHSKEVNMVILSPGCRSQVVHNYQQNTNEIPSQSTTNSANKRAELLAKLNSEKNLATTTTQGPERDDNVIAEKEKQLRMKARLQQRLAAEKRQVGAKDVEGA